jgi:hypothetical protein
MGGRIGNVVKPNMAEDAVINALESQVDCYRRLARLAELQHEHVQQSRTEGLLQVLGQRHAVLEEVATLEATIAPARRSWTRFASELPHGQRRRAELLLAESRQLLEFITAADRDDAMVLQQQKLTVSKALNQAASARQVNRTYATAAYGRREPTMDVRR